MDTKEMLLNFLVSKLYSSCSYYSSCNEYSQLREIMFRKVHNLEFNVTSNEEKLVYLTNHHWKELSILIEIAWDNTNEILYK